MQPPSRLGLQLSNIFAGVCHAQALRLDDFAAAGMVNNSLAGVAGMGGRLRQLALLGLQHVSDASLMAALAQLPLLQVLHHVGSAVPGTATSGNTNS